jgi:hypothetical protein
MVCAKEEAISHFWFDIGHSNIREGCVAADNYFMLEIGRV